MFSKYWMEVVTQGHEEEAGFPDLLSQEIAVLLALVVPPIEARSAVVVDPIFVPNKIGIAPTSPIKLDTPSGPAVAAKF